MTDFKPLSTGKALTFISHPVAVITVKEGRKLNGMTAAWVTQISINPPMLCVSISPKRYTWKMLQKAEYFGVCMLSEGQEEIANVFGTKSGKTHDKFGLMDIEPYMAGHSVPLIPGSLAAVVCRKSHQVEQGDHWALFGEVVEAWKGPEKRPLNWFKSGYHLG